MRAHDTPRQNDLAPRRPRILHAGFEDYRKPGSGGGAQRTHEINRRLASKYEITVLVTHYKGATERLDEGVHYKHIGLPLGYFGGIISYFVMLPFAMWRFRGLDLVVEDYAAPVSSALLPLWTRLPTIAMVQWLNAREKSLQYHLPFWWLEWIGLRLQRNYIVVSSDLGDKVKQVRPDADIAVIGNGVENELFNIALSDTRKDVLFIGRIEREQKGIDLLLDAFTRIVDATDAKLRIAGDGPDIDWLKREIKNRSLEDRVVMLGRIQGVQKAAEYARSAVVAMPSRFETFGMVAVEAQATGTPVVAFQIPCLREVLRDADNRVVEAFDVEAFSQALLHYLHVKSTPKQQAERRRFASNYDWDIIAKKQADVYDMLLNQSQKKVVG